jgi:4-amino-4-deoxy-L-arabinose transferase-like glycosyltransferase
MRASFPFWSLVGILLLGGFLRFYQIQEIPVGLYPDEAMNGNNALEALAAGNFKVFYPENNGREGLFINIQALSAWLFGNKAWALRVVSAVFGTLTILGVYLAAKELFENYEPVSVVDAPSNSAKTFSFVANSSFLIPASTTIALLSAFFTATSYWHLNFSRVGFRAITLPFFAAFTMYFLLKGLRKGSTLDLVAAGVFMGLGFYGYIAFRFMPFVVAVPILLSLLERRKKIRHSAFGIRHSFCAPCAVALFLFVTFVAALPIGVYFLQSPQDFIGRSGQVSVFASASPIKEFLIANAKTLGMFFMSGDCNWRHNYACAPELNPIAAVFFAVGLLNVLWSFFGRTRNFQFSIFNFQRNPNDQNLNLQMYLGNSDSFIIHHSSFIILLAWLFFMSLPATLTSEGLPHALRAIGMIAPVMILAAAGVYQSWEWMLGWLKKQEELRPLYQAQLKRIASELGVALGLLIFLVAPMTFRTYFNQWAYHEETYDAFSVSFVHIGEYLNRLSRDIKAYVLVNMGNIEVRGIPMPAQTVMFLTNTFQQEDRAQKGIAYVTKVDEIPEGSERMVIIPMNGRDDGTIAALKARFPQFTYNAPSDFLVFQNY